MNAIINLTKLRSLKEVLETINSALMLLLYGAGCDLVRKTEFEWDQMFNADLQGSGQEL